MAPARHAGALCWCLVGAAPSVRGTTVSACECAARARLAHALRPDSQRLAEVRNQTTAFSRPLDVALPESKVVFVRVLRECGPATSVCAHLFLRVHGAPAKWPPRCHQVGPHGR